MSCEGQLRTNMQVNDGALVNCGASLGEGSAQGDVAVQNQSRPDLTHLLSRGRSATCSPTPRGRTKSPNIVFLSWEKPNTPSNSAWGTCCKGDRKNETRF